MKRSVGLVVICKNINIAQYQDIPRTKTGNTESLDFFLMRGAGERRGLKRHLYLDNIITYNLHMTFNCLSQCKVTRPWLNKVHFPDQIMLLCLILFYEAAWFIDWSYCVGFCFFCLQCFCFMILQHCRTSGNRSLKDWNVRLYWVLGVLMLL